MGYEGLSVFGEVQDETSIVVRAGRSLCALDMGQSAKMKERELCCASRRVIKHGVKFKLCISEGEGCTSTSTSTSIIHAMEECASSTGKVMGAQTLLDNCELCLQFQWEDTVLALL
eukprot:scaffold3388_cov114-Skeletonema_marinoi.AAC.4